MRHYIRTFVAAGGVFVCLPFLHAQASVSKDHPIKITTINHHRLEQASAEVMTALRKQIASDRGFYLVDNLDDSPGLLLSVDCIPGDTAKAAYVCSYTSRYVQPSIKTLLGEGNCIGWSVAEAADKLNASIVMEVIERWNTTIIKSAIEMLESCLFLTSPVVLFPKRSCPSYTQRFLTSPNTCKEAD